MGQIPGTATHPRKTGGHPPGSSARITWRLVLILIFLFDRDDSNFVFVLCSSCNEVWSIQLARMIIPEFMLRILIKVLVVLFLEFWGHCSLLNIDIYSLKINDCASWCLLLFLTLSWILGLRKLEFKMQLHFFRFKDANQLSCFFSNRQI